MSLNHIEVGSVLGRRFEILSVLHGADSRVVVAFDRWTGGEPCVVKAVEGRDLASGRPARLAQEWRILSDIDHPGFVRAIDFGVDAAFDVTWLAMEKAPGRNLAAHGALLPEAVVDVAYGCLDALRELHDRGFVHLDVKPANLQFDPSDGRVVLLDLDLAAGAGGVGRGTPAYAAPEAYAGRSGPDRRADFWSLGATVAELLTGVPTTDPATVPNDVAGPLAPFLAACLSTDPTRRPGDVRAATALLGRLPKSAVRRRPPWVRHGVLLDRVLRAFPPSLRAGSPRPSSVVAVRGGSGSGKSRLLSKTAASLSASGVRVLRDRFDGASASGATLGPVRRLLAMLETAEDRSSGFDGLLDGASGKERDGIFDRLADALLSRASRRRTVLVLDDFERCDAASRDVFQRLFRQLAEDPDGSRPGATVQVLVAYDPVGLADARQRAWFESDAAPGAATVVPVPPMSRQEATLLARAAAPDFDDPAAVATLVAEAGGCPGAVVDGLNLLARGVSLADVIAASGRLEGRIAVLGTEARAVAATLALAAGAVSRAVLDVLHGEAAAERGVAELVGTGEAVRVAEGVALADADVAERLARDADAEAHARLSRALEATEAPRHDVLLHRLKGGIFEGTFDKVLDEATSLRRSGREVEAVALLEAAHGCVDGPVWFVRVAGLHLFDVLLARGDAAEARRVLESSRSSHPAIDIEWILRRARLAMREDDASTAHRCLRGLLSGSRTLSDLDRTEITIELSGMLLRAGRHAEAAIELDAPASWAKRLFPSAFSTGAGAWTAPDVEADSPERPALARYLALLGDLERAQGRPESAVVRLRAAREAAAGSIDPDLVGSIEHMLGNASLALNDLETAEACFRRALPLRRQRCDLLGWADSANSLGVVLRRRGRTAEAIEQFTASLRLRRQAGQTSREGASWISLANIHFERRELDAAARHYARALVLYRRIGDIAGQAMVLNNLGAVAFMQGAADEAERHYRESERLDRSLGNIAGALVRRFNLADVLATFGKAADARRHAEVLRRVETRRGAHTLAAKTALLEARCALVEQDAEGALMAAARATRAPGAGDDDRRDARLVVAQADFLRGRWGDAFAKAIEILKAATEIEVRCAAAEVVGAAACRTGEAACRESAPLLAEAATAAERAGMHWARFLASAAAGTVYRELEEPHRARAAFHDAFEALERVAFGLTDRTTMAALIALPSVVAFRREVADLGDEVRKRRPRVDDESVSRFLGGLKDALFEAERGDVPARRDRGDGLRGVLEVARSLAEAGNDAELHVRICDGLVHLFKAERAFLVMVDEKGRLRIPSARTAAQEPIEDPESQVSRKIVDETLRSGTGRRFDNAMSDGTLDPASSVTTLELRSVMAAPMTWDGRIRGLLYVDHRLNTGHFSGTDLDILEALAAQAAVAMDRARLERERRRNESLKLVGDLSGGVAHDFNNLLAAILGRAQELETRGLSAEHATAVATIAKAARDGAVVVRRLQDFARTRRDSDAETVDVGGLLSDVVEFTRTRWEGDALRRGIRIAVTVESARDAWVRGNPAELREVFTNLALNAVKAMPAGGELALTAVVDGETVVATVSDTGVGMTEEVRERIFDPWFTTSTEGSGLGMSVVWGIVTRHGGSIAVDSRVGSGTRMRVTLPKVDAAPSPRVESAAAPTGLLAGRRVLVVDDETSVRLVIADILSGFGAEVDTAGDGREALVLFSKRSHDVVLTDLGMLPVNGWELAAGVRRKDPSVGVVLVTGWGTEIDPREARVRGIDYVLNKPFELPDLAAIVARTVETVASRREGKERAEVN